MKIHKAVKELETEKLGWDGSSPAASSQLGDFQLEHTVRPLSGWMSAFAFSQQALLCPGIN